LEHNAFAFTTKSLHGGDQSKAKGTFHEKENRRKGAKREEPSVSGVHDDKMRK
jgi:hypothetical protein